MTITEGDYKLADEGRGKCVVKVKADGEDKWRLSVKVANTMNTLVTRAGEGMSAGPVMGTKMMPVPALEQLEKEISSLLNNLTNMKMEGGLIGQQNISMLFVTFQDLTSSSKETVDQKSLWLDKINVHIVSLLNGNNTKRCIYNFSISFC